MSTSSRNEITSLSPTTAEAGVLGSTRSENISGSSNNNNHAAASSSSTTTTTTKSSRTKPTTPPYTVGVFGGSFNPIHLGHALLAITVRQTKPVDEVVLVPVYRHAVKRDLLPFADRVNMCRLALQGDVKVTVSTIEEQVGESNGTMLRALKLQYPPHTRFWWICGDDFVRWMHRPKGLETLREVSGLMIQRRLHRSSSGSSDHDNSASTFFQEPVDEQKIRRTLLTLEQLNDHPIEIDFVYGELPHFSSTLVRRAPGHWRSFLTSAVARYLDERPHLLQQLLDNLQADAAREELQPPPSLDDTTTAAIPAPNAIVVGAPPTNHEWKQWSRATASIMRGLQVVHALQLERGHTSLRLSLGRVTAWREAQATTDALLVCEEEDDEAIQLLPSQEETHDSLVDDHDDEHTNTNWPELQALASELRRIPDWLIPDRSVVEQRGNELAKRSGAEGWLARLGLVEKFNARIDVLMDATVRAFSELLEHANNRSNTNNNHWPVTELLYKWCEGKESLGRLRALVAAGGPTVATLVRNSVTLRERLVTSIGTKERNLARVWQLETQTTQTRTAPTAPEALHKMLEQVTWMEYQLMGCFAASTPLPLVHRLLEEHASRDSSSSTATTTPATLKDDTGFDVVQFFDSCTSAIDFLLTFSKALAASACASA